MKKIYRYILISVLGVMGMSSCVDNLLDRTPIASLSPTTFYQDENQCRMALMGVYSAIAARYFHLLVSIGFYVR